MPADIRSFFGSKSTPIREKEPKKEEDSKKKRGKSRNIVDDSDDDEPAPKKATPKPIVKKAIKKESPKGKETTTSDYFASSSKPKAKVKSTPTKSKALPAVESKVRTSGRKKNSTSYTENKDDDGDAFMDDDEDAGDDIFAADVKNGSRRNNDSYIEVESDEEPLVKPVKVSSKSSIKNEDTEMKDVDQDSEDFQIVEKPARKSRTSTKKRVSVDLTSDDDDAFMAPPPKATTSSKKRKSVDLTSDDDEDNGFAPSVKSLKSASAKPPPAKKARAPAKKATPKSKSEDAIEGAAMQAILDKIPTVRAPTPPPKDPNQKWPFKGGAGNAAPPPAAGSRDMPVGADNCLAGMTFVFTGILETLGREEGQELVKRYGGRITGAPSKKTTFVVLGNEAGPSKLRKIQELGLKSIDENGLFALIEACPPDGGDGKAAEKSAAKRKADEEKIKREAEEMEKEEQRKLREAEKIEKERQKQAALTGSSAPARPSRTVEPSSQLWTSKYAPTSMAQICGNKGQVEKIQAWLKGWPKAHKYDFKMKGADGLGGYRAIIIHGPPGIGKTTAAHLAAKLADYDVIESNASDTRSKKLVENNVGDVLNNTSLLGFFAGDGKKVQENKKNIVLIMDEVDGMSAGDRGGVGALAKVCKTTDIPMILICNERKLPKMKPFDFVTFDVPFRRPTVEQVRSRIATICHREGLKLPINAIDALIEGSNKDIRQIINMISTAKLDQTVMDFDATKSMSKAWEKHVVLKPWDICHKLLGGGLFASSSKATLNDKIELYFNDHDFTPLMIQENYLDTKPGLAAKEHHPREQRLKALQLVDQAAESISDGDLVDRMIHGSQQQWSLMPTHAVFSSVRPASFVWGMMTGQTRFSQWLGNNSKQTKLIRYVKEIQSHMRLRSSGDRHEIRQQYLPVLWTRMIKRLEVDGKDCVEEVIELMDSYFLTKDDFDYMLELGLGPQAESNVTLASQTKATFTRMYNQQSHPLPFMKNSSVTAPKAAKQAAPDLEEAFEPEDEGEVLAEPKDDEDEIDLKKDKYIKQPKKKPAAKKAAPKKKNAKKDADGDDDNEDEDDEEEVKPKKAKAKPKAKSKAKK